MGLFEKIFKKDNSKKQFNTFATLNSYVPIFNTRNGQLYEEDLVRSAIDARARHISKLRVECVGTAKPSLKFWLRSAPNEWQTWSQFLYRLSTILDVQNTAFIVPIFNDYGEVNGIYPVLPSNCELVECNKVVYLKYTFSNGSTAAIEFNLCGVLNKFQYKDDFFGENNRALDGTLDLININNQGINEAVKNSASYRFIAKLNNFLNPEDLAKERERFNKNNFEGEGGGVLVFPNNYSDVRQVVSRPFTVDTTQVAMIKTNVFNYFGVNEDILQNKAIGDSWSAFYEGCVEQFAIQLSDVLTKMLYTITERNRGSFVQVTANRLQYMSNQDKLSTSAQLLDRGILNRDEAREIWNLPPLPNGEGQAYIIRGEYYSADEKINGGTEAEEE